ncbi:MAG TPA: NUDIX domain-containing protein [Prolixibacteraceae bacterium]|nr:NUDIX domain-containing protein [Prolixibacteraceae bacterium]
MYKVFFNDSTIQFEPESKRSSKNNITQSAVLEDHELVNELISTIKAGGLKKDFVILHDDPHTLWHVFKNQLVEIPAAGGLVMSSNHTLLFIRRLGVWDLPKGKIEKQESPEQAAIREVEEECGVSGLKIIRPLDSTFHIYRSPYLKFPANMVLKETKWFLMSCDDQQNLVPQADENIEEARWFAFDSLDEVRANTYSSIRDFLDKTIPII